MTSHPAAPPSGPGESAAPPPSAPDLAAVLRRVVADPGRPRLTWYGDDGERVELSGHVLDNWVSKTTNLLVEELDVGPGSAVVLDLPVHWRSVLWALATWRAGACLLLDVDPGAAVPGAVRADVVVTARPHAWTADRADVVAVALAALARRFDGPLPGGAIDAAAAVMTYADALGAVRRPSPGDAALLLTASGGPDEVAHGALTAWAARDASPVPPGARMLVGTEPVPLARVLARTLAALAADGSVVLCSPAAGAALAADPPRLERLITTERITA